MRHAGTIMFSVLTILGCQTVDMTKDQPARITTATEASQAALQSAVNTALGTDVMLADYALTDSSFLTIEYSPQRTINDPDRRGRIMEKPYQFQLVMNGADCILVDQRDGKRYRLENTRCEAE